MRKCTQIAQITRNVVFFLSAAMACHALCPLKGNLDGKSDCELNGHLECTLNGKFDGKFAAKLEGNVEAKFDGKFHGSE